MYVHNINTGAWSHDGSTALIGSEAFAVGYSGNFGPVSAFADVSLSLSDKLQTIFADCDVKFSQDALSLQVYGLYKRYGMNTTTPAQKVVLWANGSYNFGSVTGYVDFCDEDLLANNFAAVISAGAKFNIGAAAMNASVKFDCGTKTISVPLETTISL